MPQHATPDAVLRNVVVVDPAFDAYRDLASRCRDAGVGLHFRSSGAEAMRFADKRPVDAWIIARDLDDMSGSDFVELLRDRHPAAEHPGPDKRMGACVLSGPTAAADLVNLLDARGVMVTGKSGLLGRLHALPAAGIGLWSC